ncbi:MAG: hypothetical protein JEZ07_07755 [Phycisphaerae bacterium]|nr:hypothetical protein [Phycisphaerae bacterium]
MTGLGNKKILAVTLLYALFVLPLLAWTQDTSKQVEPVTDAPANKLEDKPTKVVEPKVVFITCADMIDEGLYVSIQRRSQIAIADGATHIVFEMDTWGGLLDSAISIHKYILRDLNPKVHTIAYIKDKAISAGAMISLACEDIIMANGTEIGSAAVVSSTGEIESTMRTKIEGEMITLIERAAVTNNYPKALALAMIRVSNEAIMVRNNQTDKNEFFTRDEFSKLDPVKFDIDKSQVIDGPNDLLALNNLKAQEYTFSRATIDWTGESGTRKNVIGFIEKDQNITVQLPFMVLKPNWSEQMVRWLTSPAVVGVLTLIFFIGVYAEFKTPGFGVAGSIAAMALALMLGSKYMINMASSWEIIIIVIGVLMLAAEIFVIPGFGVAGIGGIICIFVGLLATLSYGGGVMPSGTWNQEIMEQQLTASLLGFLGSAVAMFFLAKYLPKLPYANRIIMKADVNMDTVAARAGGMTGPSEKMDIQIGQIGKSITPLRPSGTAIFDGKRYPVASYGELIETETQIKIIKIEGNNIVVKEV